MHVGACRGGRDRDSFEFGRGGAFAAPWDRANFEFGHPLFANAKEKRPKFRYREKGCPQGELDSASKGFPSGLRFWVQLRVQFGHPIGVQLGALCRSPLEPLGVMSISSLVFRYL